MNAIAVTHPAPAVDHAVRLIEAAERLYSAEVALHAARQTGVDQWIAAAYARLHDAIAEHLAATSYLAA
ncbi:MAG: hypothetical protein JO147_05700 [Actinobacteria bacterium]|nr:hypothetical protein [Actinomycetota bacterium]